MNPLRRIYKRSHRLRRFIRRRKDAVTYYLARFGLWLPSLVSLPRALALADHIGNLAYAILATPRQRALNHLAMALGSTHSPAERERIARASFRNVARCFVELAKFDDIAPRFDEYASIDGMEHWRHAVDLGRGGIVITGHIGNWELLGAYFARQGLPIAAIARRINDSRLNQLLVDFRTRNGIRTILRESPTSSREILSILRQRGILALIIDQDIHAPSVSVPFFGRPARTPAAAAALAVRRDLPVVPVFAERQPGGGQRFIVMEPIFSPKTGDRRRDIYEMTHEFSRILEARIRERPEEWVWWHKRWRRGPVPRLDLDSEIQYPNPVLP